MNNLLYPPIAFDLEQAGLIWRPEVGDEISLRDNPNRISILFDSQGLTINALRKTYLWLPTVEQILFQLEARQAILTHTGLELTDNEIAYRTVLQTPRGLIETQGVNLRTSIALALRDFLKIFKEPIQ